MRGFYDFYEWMFKIFDRSNLRNERFVLVYSFRIYCLWNGRV